MDITWLLVGFFIVVMMAFAAIAFFFPEWVGITGKKAREIMKEHKPEEPK